MSDRQRFNLHLPGLLKVLAEHLYASKKVGVRELIQNAHDSCVRRKIEAGERHYRPRIDLFVDPKRLALCSPAEAAELIGQFGLGFLSAFLLASEVTLLTRSLQGGPALRWHSTGDEHYDLGPGQRDEVGT